MKTRAVALGAVALVALAAVVLAAACGGGGPSEPHVRMVIEPEEGAAVSDLDAAIDAVVGILERRLDGFGVTDAKVEREGESRVVVELPDGAVDDVVGTLGRTALLQFCEPIIDDGTGDIAIVRAGTVQYQPQTCEPVRDAEGDIQAEGGGVQFTPWPLSGAEYDQIVWQPAKAELRGVEQALDSHFLLRSTYVSVHPVTDQPILVFAWNGDGAAISGQVTERLVEENYPMAVFLDGQPIRGEDGTIIAPSVQAVITSRGSVTGLSQEDAETLSMLLNIGAFPVPMRVVEVVDI